MATTIDECPNCGVTLIGDPIPAQYLVHEDTHDEQVKRWGHCLCLPYGEGVTHGRREIGVVVQGLYDGILYYLCPDCAFAWPRFVHASDPRSKRSKFYADNYNKQRAAA
jgi:hypothetical protein